MVKRAGAIAVASVGLAAVTAFMVAAARRAKPGAAIVELDTGRIEGVIEDDVIAFKGAPYAAPPVGPLRWRPPKPHPAWRGLRRADRLGPIALQAYKPDDNGVGPLPMSEDCLTLNVWTPTARGGPLPVMVWIHGGGFVNGSATAALYDGAALARQGVVVVGVNYRLGRFGFFAHPLLSAEEPDELKGNYALMDMIAALEWVQRNIEAFGGDPANVTLFGESAGGMAVNRLMISSLAQGLFHKAISQSGAGRDASTPLAKAADDGKAFADSLGVVAETVEDLRALPAETILAAGDPDVGQGWGPIIDGKLLANDVSPAFTNGDQAKVPYVAGSNALEFPIPERVFEPAFKRLTRLSEADRDTLKAAYPSEGAFKARVVSDFIFGEPARHLCAMHAQAGAPAFLYRFSVLSKALASTLRGTPHAAERQYVFRTLGASTWPTTEVDEAAAATMSAYWVAFAKTGDPNGGGRPAWPHYDAGKDRLLEFTNQRPIARKTPDAPALDAVATVRERASAPPQQAAPTLKPGTAKASPPPTAARGSSAGRVRRARSETPSRP
ncbi:MAG TPA: carboxylesterase family protein [Caulobacteraceae bacterium]|nr:carboxylesterase family protein [Caulobacteraceae bacterium]